MSQISHPKVSVILIVYNGAKTLRLALYSMMLQTFQDWECIIIDDASTDSTSDILSTLTDHRFRVVRSHKRLGRGSARQMALESTSASYICTLDADDFFYPRKLEQQVTLLDSNAALAATVGGMFYFTENLSPMGVPVGYFPPGIRKIPKRPSHLRIPFGPTMFRRGKHDDLIYRSMPRSEDRQFFSDLLSGREIHIEKEPSYGCLWRMSSADIILGLNQNLEIYRAARERSFLWGTSLIVYTLLKRGIYRLILNSGLWERMIQLKYQSATPEQVYVFQQVVSTLRALANETETKQ